MSAAAGNAYPGDCTSDGAGEGDGRDARYAAGMMPAGMIFVRSIGGLSHREEEESSPDDLKAGANVLLHAALELAGRA